MSGILTDYDRAPLLVIMLERSPTMGSWEQLAVRWLELLLRTWPRAWSRVTAMGMVA